MGVDLDYFSRQHWDRVAQARGAHSSDVGVALVDSLVTLVGEAKAQTVLDVGAGNGALAFALATAHSEARISGLDYSNAAVRIALEELAPTYPAEVRSRLSFLTGSASELPYGSGLFDAVTMLKTAWVLPDLALALAECRRVLRPGGRVFLQSWAPPEQCAALTLGSMVLGSTIDGFVLPPEAVSPFELTVERIAGELAEAGFTVEGQPRFSWELKVDSADQYWDRLRSIAGTAYWALHVQAGPDRVRVDEEWDRRSAAYRGTDGFARLPLGWHISVGRVS